MASAVGTAQFLYVTPYISVDCTNASHRR